MLSEFFVQKYLEVFKQCSKADIINVTKFIHYKIENEVGKKHHASKNKYILTLYLMLLKPSTFCRLPTCSCNQVVAECPSKPFVYY